LIESDPLRRVKLRITHQKPKGSQSSPLSMRRPPRRPSPSLISD
jgi:hypothetical protein